jgi:hypothetical protein
MEIRQRSHPTAQGRNKVNLTFLPHLFEESQLAGFAIHDDGHPGHEKIFFLVIEVGFEAWEGLLQVVNHLTHIPPRNLDNLLPPGELL